VDPPPLMHSLREWREPKGFVREDEMDVVIEESSISDVENGVRGEDCNSKGDVSAVVIDEKK
jgi:hypothetical protein